MSESTLHEILANEFLQCNKVEKWTGMANSFVEVVQILLDYLQNRKS